MRHHANSTTALALTTAVGVLLSAATVLSFSPKEARDNLDLLVYIDPQLRVVEVTADADGLGEGLSATPEMEAFRQSYGPEWSFNVDLRRGVTGLIDGGAIPFIPGTRNDLPWGQFAADCSSNDCIPVATAENLARDFIEQNATLLGVRSDALVLDPLGSGPFGDSMYFLSFKWIVGGVPVEHGRVVFRINRGNLIQVASQRVGPIQTDSSPSLSQSDARSVAEDYLGPFGVADDRVLDNGSLFFVPVTPHNQDPNLFEGPIGTGIDYRLAWRFEFQRKDVIGTWEAVVDAHNGDLLRFVDTNEYGRVHGGAYPGDNHTGEADRPFAFADTGLPFPDNYADAGGLFPGDNATTTLQGKFARIFDDCGAINNTTTTGEVDFSLGAGTDCSVPTGNTGGPGNTHSARTQYYHLTTANLRAQGWMPGNTWLTSSYITVYTNQSPWCNATSGGDTLNFYKAASGCWNLGEIPGVALHEWGHSLDDFDGSPANRPVEGYADWMAALHLHDSCVGRGFLTSGNCGGYGDPCNDCSGIRDMDYTKHAANTPWSAANYGSVWNNSGSSYYGPCGIGSHAEGGIPSQALWDFVNRKLTGPPYNMDITSAWLLGDRLWYLVIPTLGADMYTCTLPNSNGCAGSSLFNVMKAIDDDGDGTANGTPHAAAIFAAMNDHNIACGLVSDATNQDQTSCPSIGGTTLTGAGSNNQAELSWPAATNATRYFIYRNDIGCDAGYALVGEVNAPTTTFTDTTVVNDIDYYYVIQPAGASDGCTGPVSNCEIVTPVPCETPGTPTGLSATPNGDNRIDLSWVSPGPDAASYNVYRAIGACPQPSYELIATGISGTNYVDTTVSGGLDYSYVVSARDITAGCESAASACADSQTTGDCLEAPAFDGVQNITNPGSTTCTLDLGWSAASPYCGSSVSYNVYRSTTSGFNPTPANRIASGVTGTTYSDASEIEFETYYFYVVRSVDQSNGSEDPNLVEIGSSPTGPISIGIWSDDAGDTGDAKLVLDPEWSVDGTGGNAGPMVYATGAYANQVCDGAATPLLQLGTNPQLSFWSRYDIEDDWDKGQVEISTDGGSNWERVEVNYPDDASYESDNCGWPDGDFFSGTGSTFAEYTAALDAWSNQDAMVRWTLSTDTSVNGGGWWVDDIDITEVAVPGSCTTGSSPLPGAFAKTSPADGATAQPMDVSLSWGSSLNAATYEYCVDTTDNSTCDGVWTDASGGTSANLTGLDPDTTYHWQVRASNGQGETEADGGLWWDFTTELLPLPGSFEKNAPENGSTGQSTAPTLGWSASPAATGYEYCLDTTDNGACDGTWVSVGTTTSASPTGLAEWTIYSWQVRATNTQGSTLADGGQWWNFITTPLLLEDGFDAGDLDAWSYMGP